MWITLKEYPVYEINEFGQVKNKLTGHVLKPKIDRYGYYTLGLYYNRKKYYPTLHRLLAKTFIPNPDNLPQVNHKDGNKLNNDISNLEWCTNRHNMLHALKNDLHINARHIKITNIKTNEVEYFISLKEMSRKFKIAPNNIIPYILHSKEFPFLGYYHIEITNLNVIDKLHNIKNFGKQIEVYDFVSDSWITYPSLNLLRYYTGIRRDLKILPCVIRELGYIITTKRFKVNEYLNKDELLKNRKKYISVPYKPKCESYVLYNYYTKKEMIFNNVNAITKYINKQEPLNVVFIKRAVREALNQSRNGFSLIKGFGIQYNTIDKKPWGICTEEEIILSKYRKPKRNKVFKVKYENGENKIVLSIHELFKLFNLDNISCGNLTEDEFKSLLLPYGVNVCRLNKPVSN